MPADFDSEGAKSGGWTSAHGTTNTRRLDPTRLSSSWYLLALGAGGPRNRARRRLNSDFAWSTSHTKEFRSRRMKLQAVRLRPSWSCPLHGLEDQSRAQYVPVYFCRIHRRDYRRCPFGAPCQKSEHSHNEGVRDGTGLERANSSRTDKTLTVGPAAPARVHSLLDRALSPRSVEDDNGQRERTVRAAFHAARDVRCLKSRRGSAAAQRRHVKAHCLCCSDRRCSCSARDVVSPRTVPLLAHSR